MGNGLEAWLESPDKANSIWLTKIDGSKTVAIKTPHKACAEPSPTEVRKDFYLAYTACSSGSNWRQLHIMDVTSKLK